MGVARLTSRGWGLGRGALGPRRRTSTATVTTADGPPRPLWLGVTKLVCGFEQPVVIGAAAVAALKVNRRPGIDGRGVFARELQLDVGLEDALTRRAAGVSVRGAEKLVQVTRIGHRAPFSSSGCCPGSSLPALARARDVGELMQLVREQLPDLVVLDIRMPPLAYDRRSRCRAGNPVGVPPDRHPRALGARRGPPRRGSALRRAKGVGYLLKSRVTQVSDFLETLERIAGGGAVIDPASVKELVAARRIHDPLSDLTPREREVLELMAEGRSNAGIARQLWVTEGTVHKHVPQHLAQAAALRDRGRSPPRARLDYVPPGSIPPLVMSFGQQPLDRLGG